MQKCVNPEVWSATFINNSDTRAEQLVWREHVVILVARHRIK